MTATSTSNVFQSTLLELPRTNRLFRHRVSAISNQRPEGPSCIFVGPLETANKETLEALYCQDTNKYSSFFPQDCLSSKKEMVKLVKRVIQSRRNSGISKVPKDVVDVLLNDASEQLTDDLIADNMIDMMIPGEDSVPVLMTLAIKYLSECPAALQQFTV
ncbi:Cytochrome P450 superfamily [Sesbania bispinosa]|nr:Cytochrome P450 superfamily [Sesbania bispinosa]